MPGRHHKFHAMIFNEACGIAANISRTPPQHHLPCQLVSTRPLEFKADLSMRPTACA